MGLFSKKKTSEDKRILTEDELRLHRCCFTGHRPEKLNRSETEIKVALRREINQAIRDGFNVFISGMSRGVDYEK